MLNETKPFLLTGVFNYQAIRLTNVSTVMLFVVLLNTFRFVSSPLECSLFCPSAISQRHGAPRAKGLRKKQHRFTSIADFATSPISRVWRVFVRRRIFSDKSCDRRATERAWIRQAPGVSQH